MTTTTNSDSPGSRQRRAVSTPGTELPPALARPATTGVAVATQTPEPADGFHAAGDLRVTGVSEGDSHQEPGGSDEHLAKAIARATAAEPTHASSSGTTNGLDAAREAAGISDLVEGSDSGRSRLPPPPLEAVAESLAAGSPLTDTPTARRFRQFVNQRLKRHQLDVLTVRYEEEFVRVAGLKLGLSPSVARAVTREVARSRGWQVAAEVDLTQDTVDSGAAARNKNFAENSDDPRWRKFYAHAEAVLAMHGGVNAKSRPVLAAIAKQEGIGDEELETGLELLQGQFQRPDDSFDQQVRCEAFRAYLRRAMAKARQGLIHFRLEKKLVEAGLQCHGVSPELIRPTIRQVALELGFRFVSREEAAQQFAQRLQGWVGGARHLDRSVCRQLHGEGAVWGLSPLDVDHLVRQQLTSNRRDHRRRWIRGGVAVACVLGIAVTLFCVAVFLRRL